MNVTSDYYQVGGTVHRGAQSYIVRQADEELLGGLGQGEFCCVLDSRQIGKSSLMLRTAGRLREEDSLAIILDLLRPGQSTDTVKLGVIRFGKPDMTHAATK
jgi:hypothetical protein